MKTNKNIIHFIASLFNRLKHRKIINKFLKDEKILTLTTLSEEALYKINKILRIEKNKELSNIYNITDNNFILRGNFLIVTYYKKDINSTIVVRYEKI